MTKREAKELLQKYRAGNCSEAENALLNDWYAAQAAGKDIALTAADIEAALEEVSASLPLARESRIRKLALRRVAAAAVILFSVSAGAYLLRPDPAVSTIAGNVYKNDVAPGGNKAFLELGDGSRIDLDAAAIGELDHRGAAGITKTKDNQIVYNASGQQRPGVPAFVYNTIKTPRGGQYQVVLPDGSGAWLNAASSIRFPAMFTGPERKVEITGEVYFEITSQYRDSDSGQVSIPFIVIANNQAVEVLGTHFNINAYPNEGAIKTTLLEGAVKVTRVSAHKSLFLKPGQQSLVPADLSKPLKVSRADLESTIAWKNGQFHYNMEGIATIMRQVERWYDVEVVYEGSIPKNKFVGTVSRDLSLARFLDILSYTGVNFRIEGRKIVVLS